MPTPEQIHALKGRRVTLIIAPEAGGPVNVTGIMVGVIDAADGLVCTIQPDDHPAKRLTYHYHHIVTASAI